MIRGFKSSVTMYPRKNNIEFAWQARFYDHIIRDLDHHTRVKIKLKDFSLYPAFNNIRVPSPVEYCYNYYFRIFN